MMLMSLADTYCSDGVHFVCIFAVSLRRYSSDDVWSFNDDALLFLVHDFLM
jgi:hypothetical protein